MEQLHLASDSIEIENRVIKDVYLKTKREKELLNLSKAEVSKITANSNNTIGFVKLDSTKNIKMLRCKMISIRRDDPKSESITKHILDQYKAGESFVNLVLEYSSDAGNESGGDTGWFSDDIDWIDGIIEGLHRSKINNVFEVQNDNWIILIKKTHKPRKGKTYYFTEYMIINNEE